MSLKIGYFADGIWGHNTFDKIIQDKRMEIAFVCVRYDNQDSILMEKAKENNIDALFHENINSKEFIREIKKYNCDIFVSMSFNQIFKTEIMNLPNLKTINCHAGKLPFYRGRNVLNWVLINNEKEFGITVHFIDEGIDTGDIILQRTFEIKKNDNYATLLEVAHTQCADLLYEALELFLADNIKIVKQRDIHPIGMYCGMRKIGDEIIDWNQFSEEIFNFIRAICKPGPMAQSKINGKIIYINKALLIEDAINYKGICGQVVGTKGEKFIVKTKDNTLEISEYEYDGIVKIGDRLY